MTITNRKTAMKQHYGKAAKQLSQALRELETITSSQDLAHLHRFVVDLKNALPERLAHENSQLLLNGLRVTRADNISPYLSQLKTRLSDLRDEYIARSSG